MDDQFKDDEDPMNLSALMPRGDRLEAMASAIVARVAAARRARLSEALPLQLLKWARPALAIGAGLALCLWMVGPSGADSEPTSVISQWAMNDEVPSATSILEAFESASTSTVEHAQ